MSQQDETVRVEAKTTQWYKGRRCTILSWEDPESGEPRYGLMSENRNGVVHKMALTKETLALLYGLLQTLDEDMGLSQAAIMVSLVPDEDQSEPAND